MTTTGPPPSKSPFTTNAIHAARKRVKNLVMASATVIAVGNSQNAEKATQQIQVNGTNSAILMANGASAAGSRLTPQPLETVMRECIEIRARPYLRRKLYAARAWTRSRGLLR